MNSIYNFHPLQKLWNYEGNIYDMGLEPDQNGDPAFYILTEDNEHIQVPIKIGPAIGKVSQWLRNLNTGIRIEFKDYAQFNKVIQKVFAVYGQRFGLITAFDKTALNAHMEALKGFATETDVAKLAGVGRSTVNDLTRGVTRRPHYFTICKVYSAIYELECRKKAMQ